MTARKPRYIYLIWVENKNPLAFDTRRLFMGTEAAVFSVEEHAEKWVALLQKASDDSGGNLYYAYTRHEVTQL